MTGYPQRPIEETGFLNAIAPRFSQPELDHARSAAEFNQQFSPTGLTRLAQRRMNARLDAKRLRQLRYHRQYARHAPI